MEVILVTVQSNDFFTPTQVEAELEILDKTSTQDNLQTCLVKVGGI